MFAVQYCCWLGMTSPPDVHWRISMDVTTWSREPEHHYLLSIAISSYDDSHL